MHATVASLGVTYRVHKVIEYRVTRTHTWVTVILTGNGPRNGERVTYPLAALDVVPA